MDETAFVAAAFGGLPNAASPGAGALARRPSLKRGFGALVLAVAALGAAAPACGNVEKDIPYAAPERCRLDVKWPAGKTNFPTVVWFHGGGLVKGGKHFVKIGDSIAQVAVNYRLLEKGVLSDGSVCIDDAAAAVAWTLDNIARYGGDAKRVYVSGMSAGGYLTMMVGMAPQYLKAHGHDIRELAGLAPIVSICGEEPWEWKCRSEENRLLIASCVALGHEKAWFVSCPYSDHGRVGMVGVPYVELFVNGRMPRRLVAAP